MRILTAQEGKTFAFKNEKDEEVILGSVLYLGKNDDGSRYYEVDVPKSKNEGEQTMYIDETGLEALSNSLRTYIDNKIQNNEEINDNLAAQMSMLEASSSPDISFGKRLSRSMAND